MTLTQKEHRLRTLINEYESAVVAYSGGVDSALVLAVAHQELRERALGVTAHSPSVPLRERNSAVDVAKHIGARHRIVETNEIDNPAYASNPDNRCFFCKTELYGHLGEVAKQEGIRHILNGTNLDDLGDYRPGLTAADNFSVQSPLVDAGLNKRDVRALSKQLGLPCWEKPASPCLASRIPYGEEVTREKLSMVERAEDFLLSLGYRELRVRHFGNKACVELPVEVLDDFFESSHWSETQTRLIEIGFEEVEVDLDGFRSGKLNSALT